nr:uncharacterized protein LOC128685584 isoform X2 [Cherax quadricarinatus]
MYSSGVRGGIIWLGYCSGVIFNSKRGYLFAFPFLSEECGITVEDNVVKPLYKHIINTKYTSMAFIGIPFRVCNFPLFDFQDMFTDRETTLHWLRMRTGGGFVCALGTRQVPYDRRKLKPKIGERSLPKPKSMITKIDKNRGFTVQVFTCLTYVSRSPRLCDSP